MHSSRRKVRACGMAHPDGATRVGLGWLAGLPNQGLPLARQGSRPERMGRPVRSGSILGSTNCNTPLAVPMNVEAMAWDQSHGHEPQNVRRHESSMILKLRQNKAATW